jgi:hypothetical protein
VPRQGVQNRVERILKADPSLSKSEALALARKRARAYQAGLKMQEPAPKRKPKKKKSSVLKGYLASKKRQQERTETTIKDAAGIPKQPRKPRAI